MLRQYNPQRFRYREMGGRLRHVGTIEAGEIFYWDGAKCQVTGWHTREYTAHHRDAAGRWQNVRMSGGHLAECRRLRDGRPFVLADHHIMRALEA